MKGFLGVLVLVSAFVFSAFAPQTAEATWPRRGALRDRFERLEDHDHLSRSELLLRELRHEQRHELRDRELRHELRDRELRQELRERRRARFERHDNLRFIERRERSREFNRELDRLERLERRERFRDRGDFGLFFRF